MVDAQWRWTPAIRRMKELIEEGAIGDFFTATIHLQPPLYDVGGYVYTMCSYSPNTKPYHWLADATSGASAWRNFGSHTILNLMYLFGEIDEIIGVQETFVKHINLPDGIVLEPDTADFGMALLRFKQRGIANINVSWAMADAPGYFLEVCGSKGRLVARDAGFCDTTTTLYQGDASIGPLAKTAAWSISPTGFTRSRVPPSPSPIRKSSPVRSPHCSRTWRMRSATAGERAHPASPRPPMLTAPSKQRCVPPTPGAGKRSMAEVCRDRGDGVIQNQGAVRPVFARRHDCRNFACAVELITSRF